MRNISYNSFRGSQNT